ncbi:MAG: hypothetical protein HGA37_06370 [Lentimicrobium sp.]|nr:hypothetical protein [Lentimicrobium sp.]
MKKITLTLLITLMLAGAGAFAQKSTNSGGYGHTLNLGLGVGGYYGYYHHVGHSLPVFNINYEFDVARNFTLAPFVTIYTYRNDNDHYRETILPLGVKGTYYLDQAFDAGSDWDFYIAGSLGFAIRRATWDDGYTGDTYYQDVSPLILDLHLGAEYHLSNKVGLFLDLSTGVTTLGLSFR